MKPNRQSGMSGVGRQDQGPSWWSTQFMEAPGDLEPIPAQELENQYVQSSKRQRHTWHRAFSLSILGVGVLAGILLALNEVQANKNQAELNANQTVNSTLVKPQTIQLNTLGLLPMSTLSQTNALTVNGNVDVTGSVLLSPTGAPSGAVAGQLYYSQQKNQLAYFNGSSFVYLQGGGASVTNNVTNVNNISNVTNNTTNNSGTTGITAINGTAGSLAMFDGAGGLTESLISQSGNTLSTGTGVENVTIGSANGASTTVVQGGTGNMAINTGTASGTSGTITIRSGNSSTTASGNVSIDTGASVVSGQQILDYTFETGTDNIGAYNGGVAQSSVEAHSGTYSLAYTQAVGGTWGIVQHTSVSVTPSHTYLITAWVLAGSNPQTISGVINWTGAGASSALPNVAESSSTWTEISAQLTAPAGATAAYLQFNGQWENAGYTHYIDDITITDLSSSTTLSTLTLGATSAQAITVGNGNEIGTTTINGDAGIVVNSGVGNVGISGGSVDITGSAASTITSTGGTLTLSGAGGTGNAVVVKPQADSATAFQVQSASSGSTMLTVGTANPQLVNDNMVSSAPTGTFVRGASWVAGQYVELDNGGPGVDGEVNYQIPNVGYSFNASFDFWSKAGGGDGTFLYAYDQRTPATFHLGQYYGGAGYIFAYADTIMGSYAGIYYDGTQLASAPISTTDTSTWHAAQVTKVGNVFTMYLDGSNVLNYTDASSRDLSGTNFGVGGCSCSYNGEHRATNFTMSGGPFVTTGGSTQLGGNVGIVGSLSTSAINTNQISTTNGLMIKPWNNSTSAFVIQSAYDATLFSVDTSNAIITVDARLQVNGNLSLGGHVITGGSTPTYVADVAACTSPAINVSGNDTSGTISVTTGSGCASTGALATVSFASSFAAPPHVIITPGSANAAGLNTYVDDSTISTSSFVLGSSVIPASSTTYKWNYFVAQ